MSKLHERLTKKYRNGAKLHAEIEFAFLGITPKKEKCDKCGKFTTIYEYQEGFGDMEGINKKLCLDCAEFLDLEDD